jgi:hypothetical protein
VGQIHGLPQKTLFFASSELAAAAGLPSHVKLPERPLTWAPVILGALDRL